MAHAIATRLLGAGRSATLAGRSQQRAERLAAALVEARDGPGDVNTAALDEPVRGDVVMLAVPYSAALELADRRGEELRDRIVVDLTNPVDWDTMDGLVTAGGRSGAEEIARRLGGKPAVAKAFNTTFAKRLAQADSPLDVWIAADDEGVKRTLEALLDGTGLHVVDTGPLRRARELEAIGFLHIALQERLDGGFQTAIRLDG
jgi:8-hydroxy-5-deazaflavin:NADPH oxidoreductase